MAVGECQWAKIQLEKHLLQSPENPEKQEENKTKH